MEKGDQIIGMLEQVMDKQDKQSEILTGHTLILNDHGQKLDEHAKILGEHGARQNTGRTYEDSWGTLKNLRRTWGKVGTSKLTTK